MGSTHSILVTVLLAPCNGSGTVFRSCTCELPLSCHSHWSEQTTEQMPVSTEYLSLLSPLLCAVRSLEGVSPDEEAVLQASCSPVFHASVCGCACTEHLSLLSPACDLSGRWRV